MEARFEALAQRADDYFGREQVRFALYLTHDPVQKEDKRDGDTTIAQTQWDVALRDLDFVLHIDDNGDGDIAWHELRTHQNATIQTDAVRTA